MSNYFDHGLYKIAEGFVIIGMPRKAVFDMTYLTYDEQTRLVKFFDELQGRKRKNAFDPEV